MLKWAVAVLLIAATPICLGAKYIPDKYDGHFEKYSRRYLPGVDADLLKAQCWQESRFKENAVSPVGAAGVCQFMPGTWKDASRALRLPSGTSVFHVEYNIQAAAYYMGVQYSTWKSPRPPEDRHNLALASYNAGAGHLIKAQTKCGGPRLYKDIIKCLPQVTGRHSTETINYVIFIRRFYADLKTAKGQPIPATGL